MTKHAKKVMVTAQDMSQESHKISVNVDQAHHWPIEPVHAYMQIVLVYWADITDEPDLEFRMSGTVSASRVF
jgi:hypothetical protein